ncbi:pectin acetylesterase-family hydrolase [Ideonella sp. DXS29W]|uniref:Pectin acetylesterase-family hydrolase n=1 Tax=Ideonella lacteola TaxID=2984193 RepID=A0ABU9BSK4_9BURK
MTDRTVSSLLRRLFAAMALMLLAPMAQAAWFIWETIELPMSTGASCGNGTPYRFFVNRTPLNSHLAITFEGGGACWDQDACEGVGAYSATNPDGIPGDYMSQPNSAAGGLVTPFSARLDPFQGVRTQDWTLVYMPYCTGDVHTGNLVRVYNDQRPDQPRVQYHRGQANVKAAADWMRRNLGRPGHLLLTGFSAGGVGSTANYAIVRDALAPRGRATLMADSGPLMNAPRGQTKEQSPSLPLQELIRVSWGLDLPGGMIPTLQAKLPTLNVDNMGSLSGALARQYPKDRFGYLLFQEDAIFAGFSYLDFFPDIANEPNPDKQKRMLNALWRQDIAAWLPLLDAEPNISYHVPFFRDFNESHCLTIVDFSGTGIQEKGIADAEPFINNALDRKPPMRNVEHDQVTDLTQPLSVALEILAIVLDIFG